MISVRIPILVYVGVHVGTVYVFTWNIPRTQAICLNRCCLLATHIYSLLFDTHPPYVKCERVIKQRICKYLWIVKGISEVKLTFQTALGQQHSFSARHTNGCSCESAFWDRKCLDLRGTQTLNLRILAECSKHLNYQGQAVAVPASLILALVV